MIKITLAKSLNGVVEKQRATVAALGLKKVGSAVEKKDTPQIRGMIKVVSHLVVVEEV